MSNRDFCPTHGRDLINGTCEACSRALEATALRPQVLAMFTVLLDEGEDWDTERTATFVRGMRAAVRAIAGVEPVRETAKA